MGKGQGGAWLRSLAVSNYCDPPVRHFPTKDRSEAVSVISKILKLLIDLAGVGVGVRIRLGVRIRVGATV